MTELVSYHLDDGVASIAMDDGKVNVLSPAMLAALDRSFDRAEADRAVVVLSGRADMFSAGFDLKVLRAGGQPAISMLKDGFSLAARILAFPRPVIVACPGHAVAMGVFLLLSGDYRIGVEGPYRIVANEVAIGLTMPRAAVEICRQRLTPAAFNRAVILAEIFPPEEALAAGFIDQLVPTGELPDAIDSAAATFKSLDAGAHASTKRRVRAPLLAVLEGASQADDDDLRSLV